MSVRLLHTADLHLDSAFEGLTSEKAAERRAGQFDILEEIISEAEKHRVQAVLLCGDVFERPVVSPDTSARVSKILGRTDIPVFIAPGNHDYYFSRSPYNVAEWPKNVHIFRTSSVERVELDSLTVYGAAFTETNVYQPLLSGFRIDSASRTEGLQKRKPSVFALHGELNPADPKYNPITPSDIANSGLDYLALGHIHLRSQPQKAGNTMFAYSGCPEGRGFDELGQKGAYLVEFDDSQGSDSSGSGITLQFLPLGGIRYAILSVDLTGCDDPAARILQALPADALSEAYKIILEGEYPPEALALKDISAQISASVYHAVLYDKTRLPRRIWDQAGEDTLSGLFLSLLRSGLSSAEADSGAGFDEEAKLRIELAARYGIAALNGEEAPKL